MALAKPYKDIPGTTIFDAEQSRKGYHLNQFCMSLMKAGNRARFKANERAYLDEWPMTEDQKQAVLARDLNRCIELGLCAGITAAPYKCTTEVYPDSPRATPAQCNAAQVAAVRAALDFALAHPA